jgi:hypothetical protein
MNSNDLKCFSNIFENSIIILETPSKDYNKEIAFLTNI